METAFDLLVADGVVDEVIGRLKSGKEADIYLVRHGEDVLAAKLYKERQARNFKNNVGYKEGRAVRNSRTQRAMDKGSKFGQRAAEDAWKTAEADALYKLHASGARVPKPVLFYEGVLLMELVLDAEGNAAPRLIDTPMTVEQAAQAYVELRQEMIKMLCADLIHGDLSPYNVLMGAQGPVIIDFPQVVGAAHNRQAEFFFRRDLDNIRNHLGTIDASLRARAGDAHEIWREYTRRDLTPDYVPTGQFTPPPEQRQRSGPPSNGGFRPRAEGRVSDNRPNRNAGKPPRQQGPGQGQGNNGPPRSGAPQPKSNKPFRNKPAGPVVQYVGRPAPLAAPTPSEATTGPTEPSTRQNEARQGPPRRPRFPRGRR